jgi:multiple antibiotic resistance protein
MIEQVLFIFTSLFTMINPLAAVPLYISLTQSFSSQTRLKVALIACGTAFVAMVIFAMAGEAIFNFFGINVNALRVVGGVLFFVMGFEMLRGRTVPKKLDQETDDSFGKDIAITPLGIPMICGPGAITMVILFMQEADSQEHTISVVSGIFLVCLATAFIFAVGEGLLKLLGKIGANVMMRLMGLIMMLIAVEFFFAGITYYIKAISTQL